MAWIPIRWAELTTTNWQLVVERTSVSVFTWSANVLEQSSGTYRPVAQGSEATQAAAEAAAAAAMATYR